MSNSQIIQLATVPVKVTAINSCKNGEYKITLADKNKSIKCIAKVDNFFALDPEETYYVIIGRAIEDGEITLNCPQENLDNN